MSADGSVLITVAHAWIWLRCSGVQAHSQWACPLCVLRAVCVVCSHRALLL